MSSSWNDVRFRIIRDTRAFVVGHLAMISNCMMVYVKVSWPLWQVDCVDSESVPVLSYHVQLCAGCRLLAILSSLYLCVLPARRCSSQLHRRRKGWPLCKCSDSHALRSKERKDSMYLFTFLEHLLNSCNRNPSSIVRDAFPHFCQIIWQRCRRLLQQQVPLLRTKRWACKTTRVLGINSLRRQNLQFTFWRGYLNNVYSFFLSVCHTD